MIVRKITSKHVFQDWPCSRYNVDIGNEVTVKLVGGLFDGVEIRATSGESVVTMDEGQTVEVFRPVENGE